MEIITIEFNNKDLELEYIVRSSNSFLHILHVYYEGKSSELFLIPNKEYNWLELIRNGLGTLPYVKSEYTSIKFLKENLKKSIN